jgi:hypothetical protein
MRAVLIPLPDFLDAAIRASQVTQTRYAGIVTVLDRLAERRSHLLDDLVREGGSINDVTRQDLLVAVPARPQEWRRDLAEWVLDPRKSAEDGVGAPGLFLAGADDHAWATQLWELVSDEVERCDSDEKRTEIAQAFDSSASAVCDYLGLSEDDIPSLVLLSLADRRVFVFQYGGDADDPPYQLFKGIAMRRSAEGQPDWLTNAVLGVVQEWGLAEGPTPALTAPALEDWMVTRYLPRSADALPSQPARG